MTSSNAHPAVWQGHSWALWVVASTPALLCYCSYRNRDRRRSGSDADSQRTCGGRALGGVQVVEPAAAGFFSKRLVLPQGIAIAAHRDVSDDALLAAGTQIGPMLENLPGAAVVNMRNAGAELRVLGKSQLTSDMPDLRHWRGQVWEKSSGKTLDERARGLGGISCLCAEENILALPSDRHKDHRRVCVHEFAHVVHRVGVDARAKRCITAAYKRAKAADLWAGCYAMTNEQEFFAELSMWYFGSRGDFGKLKEQHAMLRGREWLQAYDPSSYRLLHRLYSGERSVEQRRHHTLLPRWPAPTTVAAEAALRPCVVPGGDSACAITFDNTTAKSYRLWWVDYQGKRRAMGVLHPAEKKGVRSHSGHSFVLTAWCSRQEGSKGTKNEEQPVVAAFTAMGQSSRAIVREGGAPPWQMHRY